MEDSPLSLGVWFTAIGLICNAKNGISSHEIHVSLSVMQKSTWFLMHPIRIATKTGSFGRADNDDGDPGPNFDAETDPERKEAQAPTEFEADKTFIGGQRKNPRKARKATLGEGRGTLVNDIVTGILAGGIDKGPSRMIMAKRIPTPTWSFSRRKFKRSLAGQSSLHRCAAGVQRLVYGLSA